MSRRVEGVLRYLAAVLLCVCICSPFKWATAHPGGVDECGCHVSSRSGERHCHQKRAKASCDERVTFSAQRPPKAGDEGALFGPFVSIVDGDSFKVKLQGVVMDVRLQGIDAPEIDQPFGRDARKILERFLRDKEVVLVFEDVDHYGRIVARAWVGRVDINREMILRGAAWFDAEYAHDDELFNAEQTARDAKNGLWSLPLKERIEPWVWRRRTRE